jgi:hypothetical protein
MHRPYFLDVANFSQSHEFYKEKDTKVLDISIVLPTEKSYFVRSPEKEFKYCITPSFVQIFLDSKRS